MLASLRALLRGGRPLPGRANYEWSLSRCDEMFAQYLCWSEVRQRVQAIIGNRNLDLAPDYAEGAARSSSLSRTLSVILSVVIERLNSGELSIHRGTLSGWGHDYLGLGKDVIHGMVSSGATPVDELEEELEALEAIAAEAG